MIDSLKVGPIRHTVKVIADLHDFDGDGRKTGSFGRVRELTQEIQLCAENGPDIQRVTLIHEALHAILYAAGIAGDHDERVIDALAYGLVSLLRDNPALVGYLTSDT